MYDVRAVAARKPYISKTETSIFHQACSRSLGNVTFWLKLAWLINFSTVFQPYLVIKNDTLTENCAVLWEISPRPFNARMPASKRH